MKVRCASSCSVKQRVETAATGPSFGELKLDPSWDELRGDPRFDELIEEAAQSIPERLLGGTPTNSAR